MSVRYKFKSTILPYETITFEGNLISLCDFKTTVVQQKNLSKIDDDLQVINAETKQEFKNEDLIPKNTTLIVSRIPKTPQRKKSTINKLISTAKNSFQDAKTVKHVDPLDKQILDFSKLNISEEEKIEVMMEQSTSVYNPKTYQKSCYNGPVSKNYRCNRCYLTGHWVKDCPLIAPKKLNINENRKKAGIPRSFLEKQHEKENNVHLLQVLSENKQPIVPDDLQCPICNDVFVDPVMIPCCGNSFCDDCVRAALLEAEENQCPSCKESYASVDSLIPNRYLRNSVNAFNSNKRLLANVTNVKDEKNRSNT